MLGRGAATARRLMLVFFIAFALSGATGVAFALAAAAKKPPVAAPPYAGIRDEAHAQLVGTGADCFAYAKRAYLLLQAQHHPVRLVIVAASDNLYDTHTFVEVKSNGRWAIQDPTFLGWWSIDGHAASAADLQNALAHNRLGAVLWHGPVTPITTYYVNPLLLFRTVSYEHIDANGGAVSDSARTVSLPNLYYAVKRTPGSIAQVMVVHGGANWRIGSYAFMDESNGTWVSPIGFLDGLTVSGDGAGQVEVLSVPRFPASHVVK